MAPTAADQAQRKRELAAIHVAVSQLGLDDETYRALLREQLGVASAKELDGAGRHRLLEALRQRGWVGRQGAPADRQAAKIRALWGELERRGLLRDASLAALRAFTRRMTGVAEPRWITAEQSNVVIEGLKAWLRRGPIVAPTVEGDQHGA